VNSEPNEAKMLNLVRSSRFRGAESGGDDIDRERRNGINEIDEMQTCPEM